MRTRGIDGIVAFGETTLADPDLTYVAGGNLARGGTYFKRAGRSPLLLVSNLDFGTATRIGRVRRIETFTHWEYEKLLRRYHERDSAYSHLISRVLRHEGVRGRVVLLGRNDLARGLDLADRLRRLGVKVVGQPSPTVLEVARERKDPRELEEIRKVGRKTAKVVKEVLDALRNMREKRGHLLLGKKRATIGLVKSMISSKLAGEGLFAPESTIFAIGPSGADPHNLGNDPDEIKKAKLIVFDIFPQAKSGYWFDLTRSFVVGRADVRSRKLFETVKEAQVACLDYLKAGVTGDGAMNLACDVIERAGYKTVRAVFQGKAKDIPSGFIHSLGHGVGLTIGERPYLQFASNDLLRDHQVVTVEPGVYVPGFGGVRIEDTVAIKSNGVEQLARVEKELELN